VPFFRSFGRSWFEFGTEGETYHLGTKSLSGNERNRLWRNDGDGTFTEVGWVSGVASPRDGRGFVAATTTATATKTSSSSTATSRPSTGRTATRRPATGSASS